MELRTNYKLRKLRTRNTEQRLAPVSVITCSRCVLASGWALPRYGLEYMPTGTHMRAKADHMARAHTGPRQAAAVANRAEVGRGQAAYAVRRALCPVCARARPRVVGV